MAANRRLVTKNALARMSPSTKDGLPSPAEIDGRRMRWVGFGWVDEGPSDGSEPLEVVR